MKKLLLVMAILLGACSISHAGLKIGDLVDKIPELNQGIAINLDGDIAYLFTADLLEKWGFSLEIGYASKDSLVGVISYKLIDLKDHISIPILEELIFRPGFFYSWDRINRANSGESMGLSMTFLKVKF